MLKARDSRVLKASGVESRLQRLERDLARLKTPQAQWIEVLKATTPLIAGVTVVLVGYFLTGSINNALQERQYQLSNVKEMRDLLLTLESPGTSLEEARANVRTLSAFGDAAIPPLISLLESGGETKILVAQEGLRAVALSDREQVCSQLTRIIENRTRLFSWETHLWVIKLVGGLDCQSSLSALDRYNALLDASSPNASLDPYSMTIAELPPLTKRSMEQLKAGVDKSLTLLKTSARLAAP